MELLREEALRLQERIWDEMVETAKRLKRHYSDELSDRFLRLISLQSKATERYNRRWRLE